MQCFNFSSLIRIVHQCSERRGWLYSDLFLSILFSSVFHCFTVIGASVSSQMKLFILLAVMVLHMVYTTQNTVLIGHYVQCLVSVVHLNCVTYLNILHDFPYFAAYNEIRDRNTGCYVWIYVYLKLMLPIFSLIFFSFIRSGLFIRGSGWSIYGKCSLRVFLPFPLNRKKMNLISYMLYTLCSIGTTNAL